MTTPGVGMVAPYNQSDMGVNTNMLQTVWQMSTTSESVIAEPLFNNQHLIEVIDLAEKNEGIGDSIFVDVTPKNKGARKVVLSFLKALSTTAIEGNGTAYIGNEGNKQLKSCSAYANDWGVPLADFGFGIDKRELGPYDIDEATSKLLWQWYGEYQGYCARYAMCKSISRNITVAPLSQTAGTNQNIFFPVLSETQQPSFVENAGEYTEVLGDAMTLAGASRTTNQLTVSAMLDSADYMAYTKYLMPTEIAGKQRFLLGLSRKQMLFAKKSSTTDSVGDLWTTSGADLASARELIPEVEAIIGDYAVFLDPRAPTVVLGGSNSAWAQTFGFMLPGRNDGRTTSVAATAFDVAIVYGKRSLIKYESAKPELANQLDDYGRYKGTLLHGGLGYNTARFAIDTPTDSIPTQQEGCGLILTNRL